MAMRLTKPPNGATRPRAAPDPGGTTKMSSTIGIVFELLFSGAALAFGVWQLISVRRAQREDAGNDKDEGASSS